MEVQPVIGSSPTHCNVLTALLKMILRGCREKQLKKRSQDLGWRQEVNLELRGDVWKTSILMILLGLPLMDSEIYRREIKLESCN